MSITHAAVLHFATTLHVLYERFQGAEAPKHLPYQSQNFNVHNQSPKTRLVLTYLDATSSAAITRLSCTSTHRACAQWCQFIQLSSQNPDASRRPQKPTCQACVVLFRAPHMADFHRFTSSRVYRFHAIKLRLYGSLFLVAQPAGWIGSKNAFQHPAPVVAQRAQLRALRFSSSYCTVGDRAARLGGS